MNFFSKSFFSIWYLVWAKIFPPLSKNFQQNCQNWISCVQLSTLTKTLCWLCETIFDSGQGNVWFAAENLQPCYQVFSFVSRWAIGRIVLKKVLLFLIFSGDAGNISWCFRWIILGKIVKTAFFPAKRNISIRKKILIKHFFHHFRTMREFFLNFHCNIWGMVVKTTVYVFRRALWEGFRPMREIFKFSLKRFRHDCQNYSLRVQRSTVRKVFFWEFFKRVLGLKAIIVQTSGEKFQQRCPNCPKKVSSVLSKLHSKRRRTFRGNFFQKRIFFNWFWFLRQNFMIYQRKVSSRVVKTVFYVSSGPLWERLSYFLKFSKVFELWAIIVRTSG